MRKGKNKFKELAFGYNYKTTMAYEKFISAEEAAKYLKIKKSYLYKLVSKRIIPYYKLPKGRKIYFIESELYKLIVKNKRLSITDTNELSEDILRN